jgi:hypothetical protein
MDETMYDWAARASEALDLPPDAAWVSDPATVREVLDLARDVARGVARPAAPIGAFVAGVAIGLGGAGDPAALQRVRAVLEPTLDDGGGDGDAAGG